MIRDEDLEAALYDPDPVARDGGRARVAQEATARVVEVLIGCLDAPQRMTRRRTARILTEIRPRVARGPLIAALSDAGRAPRPRAAAARILGVLAEGEEPALAAGLRDPLVRVRRACASTAAPPAALVVALRDAAPEVAERAAGSLLDLSHVPPAEALPAVDAGPCMVRLRARAAPDSPALGQAALAGDETALDHLAAPAIWAALLDEPARRVAAAWGLARAGRAPLELVDDIDPRARAALARALPVAHPSLRVLSEDPDPGVAWLAQRARTGAYAAHRLEARLGRHARLDAPSARPPYGLHAGDPVPTVERAHAALALYQTRFDVNLGVAVRSAEAAGLREVWLVGRGELFRSPARGTDRALPVRHAPDAAALVRAAREGDYQIVAVQQTPSAVSAFDAPYPPRPLFVLGAEDTGLPPSLRREADLVVEIPLYGVIDSLNVAACATTVMFLWRASLSS